MVKKYFSYIKSIGSSRPEVYAFNIHIHSDHVLTYKARNTFHFSSSSDLLNP